MTSGFTAVYAFIYCVHFYFTKLELQGLVSMIVYFGYTLIMCFLLFVLTGNTLVLVERLFGCSSNQSTDSVHRAQKSQVIGR